MSIIWLSNFVWTFKTTSFRCHVMVAALFRSNVSNEHLENSILCILEIILIYMTLCFNRSCGQNVIFKTFAVNFQSSFIVVLFINNNFGLRDYSVGVIFHFTFYNLYFKT